MSVSPPSPVTDHPRYAENGELDARHRLELRITSATRRTGDRGRCDGASVRITSATRRTVDDAQSLFGAVRITSATRRTEHQLAFTMPEQVEEWITANEDERITRTRQIKTDLLSTITIYDEDEHGEQFVYRLRYAPGSLRRR